MADPIFDGRRLAEANVTEVADELVRFRWTLVFVFVFIASC